MPCENIKVIENSPIENVGVKELTLLFDAKWRDILPKGFRLVDKEHKIYGSFTNNFDRCGRIDYIFRKGEIDYITEVELGYDNGEIWTVFKVLAYKNAYLIDNAYIKSKQVRALAILNSVVFHPNSANILIMSGIDYIFIDQNAQVFRSSLKENEY